MKASILLQPVVVAVLTYVEGVVQLVMVEKICIKFIEPADAKAIPEGVTEVGYGVGPCGSDI